MACFSAVKRAASIVKIKGTAMSLEAKPMSRQVPQIVSINAVRNAEKRGKGIPRDWK